MRIEGFKALDPVDLTVSNQVFFLIGANGAGKSSILQALAFARAFAESEITAFLDARQWDPKDVHPKTVRRTPEQIPATSSSLVRFRRRASSRPVRMSFLLENPEFKLFWEFAWSSTTQRTVEEEIWISTDGRQPSRMFTYDSTRSAAGDDGEDFKLGDFFLNGSLTAFLRTSHFKERQENAAFRAFRSWCSGITSLELLSPVAMRRGNRGSPTDIGQRGERLAGFLASLPADQRAAIVDRLARFYPLNNLETTRKRAGWVDVQISEVYKGIGTISPAHMSDGFFRLLALCSIPQFGPSVSTVLLDEVEDGIEPHILPDVIRTVSGETEAQLIMTSHSPLLINFFEPSQIAFLTRDSDGRTVVVNSSELDVFRTGQEYFGSGEIWVNTNLDRLAKQVQRAGRRKNLRDAQRVSTIEARAHRFLSGRP